MKPTPIRSSFESARTLVEQTPTHTTPKIGAGQEPQLPPRPKSSAEKEYWLSDGVANIPVKLRCF